MFPVNCTVQCFCIWFISCLLSESNFRKVLLGNIHKSYFQQFRNFFQKKRSIKVHSVTSPSSPFININIVYGCPVGLSSLNNDSHEEKSSRFCGIFTDKSTIIKSTESEWSMNIICKNSNARIAFLLKIFPEKRIKFFSKEKIVTQVNTSN